MADWTETRGEGQRKLGLWVLVGFAVVLLLYVGVWTWGRGDPQASLCYDFWHRDQRARPRGTKLPHHTFLDRWDRPLTGKVVEWAPFKIQGKPVPTKIDPIYSLGPNGIDEHGEGDDLALIPFADWPLRVQLYAILAVGRRPLLWFVFVTSLLSQTLRIPRRPLVVELALAGLLAAFLTAVMAFASIDLWDLLEPYMLRTVAVPPRVAMGLTLGGAFVVAFCMAFFMRKRLRSLA